MMKRLVVMALAAAVLVACSGDADTERSGTPVDLPASVVGDDLLCLVHLDMRRAHAEAIDAALDALYAAIPVSEHTRQVRLLADGVRGELTRRYRRFHRAFEAAGVIDVVVCITVPREHEPEWGLYTTNDEFALLRTRPDGSRDALASAAVQAGFVRDFREAMAELTDLEDGWFLVARSDLASRLRTRGNVRDAQAWGQRLGAAGDGVVRLVVLPCESTRDGLRSIAVELGREWDDPEIGRRLHEVVPGVVSLSASIALTQRPSVRALAILRDDDTTTSAESVLRELVDVARNASKIGLATSGDRAPVEPEVVDRLFNGLVPKRTARRLDVVAGWQQWALAMELLCATSILEEYLDYLVDGLDIRR